MADSNSHRTWSRIKEDGRLSGARQRAYDALRRHGPCTAQELVRASGYQHAEKRLSELERQRVVSREGSRTCRVTGETAAVWVALEGAQPIPLKRQPALSLADRIEALERRLAQLEARTMPIGPATTAKPVQLPLIPEAAWTPPATR